MHTAALWVNPPNATHFQFWCEQEVVAESCGSWRINLVILKSIRVSMHRLFLNFRLDSHIHVDVSVWGKWLEVSHFYWSPSQSDSLVDQQGCSVLKQILQGIMGQPVLCMLFICVLLFACVLVCGLAGCERLPRQQWSKAASIVLPTSLYCTVCVRACVFLHVLLCHRLFLQCLF